MLSDLMGWLVAWLTRPIKHVFQTYYLLPKEECVRTYPADTVANFFIARANPEYGDLLTNLKLQKLVYYAAGVMAGVRLDATRPLLHERLKAWQHGPVVPSLWHRFNAFGAQPIEAGGNVAEDELDAPDAAILEDVYGFYGQYSAWKLRTMSHEERPWLDAYARRAFDDEITTQQLEDYFRNEISQDYRDGYREAQQNFANTLQEQRAGAGGFGL